MSSSWLLFAASKRGARGCIAMENEMACACPLVASHAPNPSSSSLELDAIVMESRRVVFLRVDVETHVDGKHHQE